MDILLTLVQLDENRYSELVPLLKNSSVMNI
jgi:hypothetical protein